jgi:hypothetical protein
LATFAATKEEALRHFHELTPRAPTCQVKGGQAEACSAGLAGVALCWQHYENVTLRADVMSTGEMPATW